jgi:hypothetical protein
MEEGGMKEENDDVKAIRAALYILGILSLTGAMCIFNPILALGCFGVFCILTALFGKA